MNSEQNVTDTHTQDKTIRKHCVDLGQQKPCLGSIFNRVKFLIACENSRPPWLPSSGRRLFSQAKFLTVLESICAYYYLPTEV